MTTERHTVGSLRALLAAYPDDMPVLINYADDIRCRQRVTGHLQGWSDAHHDINGDVSYSTLRFYESTPALLLTGSWDEMPTDSHITYNGVRPEQLDARGNLRRDPT